MAKRPKKDAKMPKGMAAEKPIPCGKCKVERGKNVLMEKQTNGEFIIDRCPECGGIYLDKQEIQHIEGRGFLRYMLNYFRCGGAK